MYFRAGVEGCHVTSACPSGTGESVTSRAQGGTSEPETQQEPCRHYMCLMIISDACHILKACYS